MYDMKNSTNLTLSQSTAGFRLRPLLLGILALMVSLLGPANVHAQGFEAEISAFERADLTSPPPTNPVLFVGSSSIRVWPDLPGDFPDYPAVNRGFGGSHMSDLLYYFDRIVAPYDPAQILVYEGDNDLASGKSVDTVYADYLEFVARVEAQLPRADIAFIATKPSPSRSQYLEVTRQLNERLTELADNDPHIWFIDIFTPMLNDSGQPQPELFGNDMLHMNATGYVLWQSIVAPVLAAWAFPEAQTFLFDFGAADATTQNGPAPDDPANFWNNVTPEIGGSATGQLLGLVNAQNAPTEIGLVMLSPFNSSGPNQSGTLESVLFAPNATSDSLYANTEAFSGFGDLTPSFKLTGLDPELIYNFTFYASRLGAGDVRETGYTVTGANSTYVTLDPANNVDDAAIANGMAPDAQGEITINLEPTANSNNGYHFIYLGAMKMDEIPEQSPIVFVEEPVDQTVMEYRSATFEADVDSTPPYTVQWLLDGEPIADANDFTYTLEVVTPDLDGAAFSVNVSNLLHSATSGAAVLTVVPDTDAPVLLSAASTNGYTIELRFDERLDPATATVLGNYVVSQGSLAIAELDADGKTVVLTLSERFEGAFSVVVSGVQDMAGNEILAGSTASDEVRLQVLLFDFGAGSMPTEDDPGNIWNNISEGVGGSDSGKLLGLITVDGRTTEIDLVMLSRFNGANQSGTVESALFPANATRDSLYGNTEAFNSLTDIFPSFKLTGLDPLLTYDFTFYASRMGARDNRETGYTITGANSGFAALNATVNTDAFATAIGIEPDAAGEITISIAPNENNNNGNHFTYLGVMKIEPTPDSTGN
jgi:lysophospholipase L1-like esterase